MPPFSPLFIDGDFVSASTKQTFEVYSPISGEIASICASASSDDCNSAIQAAAKAFKTWEHTSLTEKRDIFLKAADLVATEKYITKAVQTMIEETSSTSSLARQFALGISNFLRTQVSLLSHLKGDYYPSDTAPGAQVITQRRALGVTFGIAPWNAPLALAIRAITVPILCGNTVVLKGSEQSPRSQLVAIELFQEAGLPKGVLNFLSMSKDAAPVLIPEIIANPLVRHVNFTGSARVGRIIAVEAAKHLKPSVLELGGKAPTIVLNDAPVLEAAKAITFGAMLHSGQICMSTERVIVQSAVADQLISVVQGSCKLLKAGNSTQDPSASLGPLFSEASGDTILGMIQEALALGAELLVGNLTKDRTVMQPHVLKGVKPGMRLWEQESFGPVVIFTVVDTVDEAIDLANASDYSLTSSVWTADVFKGQAIASRIHAGYSNINGPTIHSEPTDGLVGLGGSSGYGRFHFENFTNKTVMVMHPLGRKYPFSD